MSAQNEVFVKEFNADMGELSINVAGSKHWKRFAASQIAEIKKNNIEQKKLFGKKSVQRLEIVVDGDESTYIIQKDKFKDDFEWVEDVLKKFAEKNKITFEG
ncbi:MAG: PH domain-containing protein [Xylanivirga thermophila]|jgi:hypothetical protein|uniref:hypothetical protein n=1 Tax=Xylanivirga thermophila TaxID=2496273 RepID=UPI00101D150F|nr:hypothetical protein [Xylanivirga thermophila]